MAEAHLGQVCRHRWCLQCSRGAPGCPQSSPLHACTHALNKRQDYSASCRTKLQCFRWGCSVKGPVMFAWRKLSTFRPVRPNKSRGTPDTLIQAQFIAALSNHVQDPPTHASHTTHCIYSGGRAANKRELRCPGHHTICYTNRGHHLKHSPRVTSVAPSPTTRPMPWDPWYPICARKRPIPAAMASASVRGSMPIICVSQQTFYHCSTSF